MKKRFCCAFLPLLLTLCLLLSGCRNQAQPSSGQSMGELNGALSPAEVTDAYRTSYEVFVYSFADSDGDYIGDLHGLQEKLPYIVDEMGFSEIWLMPIFPSPTYHKYDTTDYMAIDPVYGTMPDFQLLLQDCHDRDVRLILDLALNHTSTEHPWFRQAASYLASLPENADPVYEDCPYVWYYNFTKEPYAGCSALSSAGLTYDGTESYMEAAGASKGDVIGADSPWYYEARFWSGMPDLNLSTEAVREEFTRIAKFWLDLGVDGFRLDALTSYYTDNTPASIDFIRWFTETAKAIKPDAYLVGECWTNQADYAKYYESGIDSLFDFEFAGNEGLIASIVRGSQKASAYAQACASEEALYASYNPSYINAPFYTNHDMARSTGYYAYDDGSRTKLAGALNLMQTGNCFVYYGEELGMKGSGKDENKRAPMYWVNPDNMPGTEEGAAGAGGSAAGADAGSGDAGAGAGGGDAGAGAGVEGDAGTNTGANAGSGEGDAAGSEALTQYLSELSYLCGGPPEMDTVEHKFGSLFEQRNDPLSIWNYYRNAILIRGAFPAIARGTTTLVDSLQSDTIGAFTRTMGDSSFDPVMIVFNTSENSQTIDLSGIEYQTLAAVLTVSEENVSLSEGKLTLPAFGLAVLTE
ncbi:MAG: hypothetical protein J6P72_00455 [Firmicutes bacterium]|nr:hypothetical protein [Bacillota bacterium]